MTLTYIFNDDIMMVVAAMLEEKTEFVQTYFANPDFQNFVNARVYQAAVSSVSPIALHTFTGHQY